MVECLKCAFVVITAIAAAAAEPSAGSFQSQIYSFADNVLGKSDNLQLTDGVKIVKTSDEEVPRALDDDLGTALLNRVDSYLRTHAIRLDFNDVDIGYGVRNIGRAMSDLVEEGRGRKGNKKGKGKMKNVLIPLLLGIKAKAALLAAAMANTIAMIAGKAIIVSKIALILGFFLFLKKLVQNPPKEVQHQRIKHKKIYLPSDDPDPGILKTEDWSVANKEAWAQPNTDAHQMAYRRQMAVNIPSY